MSKSKLQNVKAIKQILSGAHQTQTNKTFGFSGKLNELCECNLKELIE